MPQNLRVLLIEDSENDAELLLRQLKKAGYAVFSRRVLTSEEMEAALAEQAWDIVMADFRLPRFDAPSALALLKKSGRDLPFIVVSGAVGEEAAVGLMKAGASDYLMKDNLARLAPVVERELGEAHRRAEYRVSENLLRENEARFRAIFEYSPIALWEEDFSAVRQRIEVLRAGGVTDFQSYFNSHPEEVRTCAGMIRVVDTNLRCLELYGASSKQQLLASMDRIIPPDLPGAFVNELVRIAAGSRQFEHETVNLTLAGARIDVYLNWMVVSGHEEDLSRVIVSVQDISQRKQSERQLREAGLKLRSLVEQVPAIVYTELAEFPGQISYISPQIEAFSGYSPQEWQAEVKFGNKFIHPDDLAMYAETDERTHHSGAPFSVEYRLVTRDGRTVWVHDEAVLIRDEDGQPMFWQGIMQDITERKDAEARLEESQRRLAQLMSNLPGMAFRCTFKPDWRMEFASEGALALTGYLPEELTSGPEELYLSLIQKDDYAWNRKLVQQAVAQKRPYELTYRINTAGGQEKWVWEHGQGIYDPDGKLTALEGFIIDVTDSKQAEALIQRQLSELEVLFQNSLAINQVMDPREIAEKVIDLLEAQLGWHRAAIRLYNSRTDQVELLALNRHGQNAELEEQESRLSQKITASGQGLSGWVYLHGQAVRSPRVQADSRYFETYPGIRSGLYVPLLAGEHVIGSISVESEQENAFSEQDERLLTTIANQAAVAIEKAQLFVTAQQELAARVLAEAELVSAHSRLEQRVVERTAELKAANMQLEKAGRLKDEFLASMSHELRTPLTGILGLADVLQLQSFGNLSEKQLAALKNISTSGRHLLELINDILDLSKIEARQLVLRPGPCDLQKMCQWSLNAIKEQCQQKNLAASLAIESPDLKVMADAQRLKQMLANLLSNAVKFTPPGGKLGIEVSAQSDGRTARITVWDTGIGIRADDLPRLFQTFVQLDASLTRRYNGTGLGLALVKRLAELNGGSVSVESVYGAGSRFTLQLPLAA